MSEVTRILRELEQGKPVATGELLPLVYQELRRLAVIKMAAERPNHTLQPTALVHEAWLKLVHPPSASSWQNRAHFFAAAAEAMRRILVDHARHKNRQRRGSGVYHEALHDMEVAAPLPDVDLLALDEALERFAQLEPRQAELVKLRFFVGLTIEESAEILGISPATAKRWWSYCKAWLYHEIS